MERKFQEDGGGCPYPGKGLIGMIGDLQGCPESHWPAGFGQQNPDQNYREEASDPFQVEIEQRTSSRSRDVLAGCLPKSSEVESCTSPACADILLTHLPDAPRNIGRGCARTRLAAARLAFRPFTRDNSTFMNGFASGLTEVIPSAMRTLPIPPVPIAVSLVSSGPLLLGRVMDPGVLIPGDEKPGVVRVCVQLLLSILGAIR